MDIEALFKPRLPEDTVDIPGVGTVRVRALNRVEAMRVENCTGTAARERLILALGMVDPAVTEAQAERWQAAAPAGELEPVTVRIAQLSGLLADAPKSGVAGDGDGPGAGVRVLPGDEAGPDGGGAAGEPEQ